MVPHLELNLLGLNLLAFLNDARSVETLIAQFVLQAAALIIREHMLKAPAMEKEHSVLQFEASGGLVDKCDRRHALRSIDLNAEGGQVQVQTVAQNISILR